MIRFLQTDNRLTKALLVVVIGAASVSMVVYLIPGLSGMGSSSPDTYAVVYPHWYSRIFSSGTAVSNTQVDKLVQQQMQQNHYPDSPIIQNLLAQRVGQQLVQQQVLLQEAARLGITATDDDVRTFLQTGPDAQVLYPDGKFIGQDAYANLIATRLNETVADFEQSVKTEIALRRLQAYVTAGVTVSPQEVRDLYRKANTKIKFDYAVISADNLRNTINPSDADLQAFFKQNAARYASAVPEQRTITYFAFAPDQIPGGMPQPTQQQIQQYYNAHLSEYSVPEESRSRHILISVPANADAKTDAAAKAKAEMVMGLLKKGGDWSALAKQYSDDPGSKNSGGELGFVQHGTMVPSFDQAIFSQKIGDIQIVKSQFGYHVVQVEERKTAHTQPLSEVEATIKATLARQASAQAQQNYASQLAAEAVKNGMAKTAAAHNLQLVTSQPVAQDGVISALADSTQLLAKAFQAKQGAAPQFAPTGEGYAIFQVTGITPAHAPAFADWKSHILDDYRTEKLPALLSEKTTELDAKAKTSGDLAKAAKAVGATLKTSDLVTGAGQVPDLGEVGQVAPQLLQLSVGAVSGPIDTQTNGIVAKIVDKQEPTADEITKNFDQTRDQLLEQRREESFELFMSQVWDYYKTHKLIQINAKAQTPPAA